MALAEPFRPATAVSPLDDELVIVLRLHDDRAAVLFPARSIDEGSAHELLEPYSILIKRLHRESRGGRWPGLVVLPVARDVAEHRASETVRHIIRWWRIMQEGLCRLPKQSPPCHDKPDIRQIIISRCASRVTGFARGAHDAPPVRRRVYALSMV